MSGWQAFSLRKFWNLYWIVVVDQVEFLRPVSWAGRTAAWCFSLLPALPITLRLAKFDRLIAEQGLAAAADWLLHRYYHGYSAPDTDHEADPGSYMGGALLYANHVGLADVLALLSWWGKRDVYLITRERALLRALPALHSHTLSIGTSPADRRNMLKSTSALLSSGANVLLFPAGRIEDDPWSLNSNGETAVGEWSGLLGYLIGRGYTGGYEFTIQPVLTGNVYAPVAHSLYDKFMVRSRQDSSEKNKYLAFFTFIFRLSRYQPVKLIPDRVWYFTDIPAENSGKKALTAFFRKRLITLAGTITRYSSE
ncbi:MAG TPA: hypothetical protein VJ967_06855 [Clostridia bacterium]|nr:hypothetical protein [Clostridia bacterium]